jgi:peptide-methionine (S)-S-oxide reductase
MMETAVLAGGCSWGLHELFRVQPGVVATRLGYTGGEVVSPTHQNHGSHIVAIEITYDPVRTDYHTLLELFFQIHDPTALTRQGDDAGLCYGSVIFTMSDEQQRTAESMIADINASGLWPGRIFTEVVAAGTFWEAELEKQDCLQGCNHYTCQFIMNNWRFVGTHLATSVDRASNE